jgi:hypothetical protein
MTLFDHETASPVRSRRRGTVFRILPTVLALGLVAAGVFGYLGFQRLVDQYTVWTFTPAPGVASIIESSRLTSEGRFLFLASRPVIETSATFASSCASNREGSGILGCYLPRDRSIHLFDVTDPRLGGLSDVVAAHEMLHAAWDRMSAAERQQLTPLLEAEAAKLAGDAEFQTRMAYYAKNEPGERDNELHSIIGTEVASIGPALEAHYARWLGNREAIVALQARTIAVFTDLQKRSSDLSAAMAVLQTTIDDEYTAYTGGYARLNADIRLFNARTDFTSTHQIDQAKRELDARRAALDARYSDILARTTQYNADVAALNALGSQTAVLNRALNHAPSGGDIPAPAPASGAGG